MNSEQTSSPKIDLVPATSWNLNRRHSLFGLFALVLLALTFEPVRRLFAMALSPSNALLSYIPMIPFISAVLIYWNRETIFKKAHTSVLPFATAAVIGGVIYYTGLTLKQSVAEVDYLAVMTTAIVTLLLGGVLLIYGTSAFRAGLFPFTFLYFLVPLPSGVSLWIVRALQHGSSDVVAILFALTGTPAYRNDVVFQLPGVTIEVAEACSGIHSTLGILIITLIASYLFLKSNWMRTVLVLAVAPISLIKNAVRIVALTLLAIHVDMGFLKGRLHHEGGIVFMMIGLVLMYPLLALLKKLEAKNLDSGARS